MGVAMRRASLLEQSPPFARYEEAAIVECQSDGDEEVLSGDFSTREKPANIEVLRAEGFFGSGI